jgi:hypothetical protein
MLAYKFTQAPTYSWREMLEQLSHWGTIALVTNMVFYAMLIFGSATIFFALKRPK